MKLFYIILIPLTISLIVTLFLGHHVDDDTCDLYDLHHHCDLSGWLGLLYGDVFVGLVLALVFHVLVSASNKKINDATLKIDQIITEQQMLRDRRQTYVIQSLKNHFNSLLLCIGMINNFMDSDNETQQMIAKSKKVDLEQILRKGQATINLSIDVLDPMLIQQIDKLFSTITNMSVESKDGKIGKADDIKTMIKTITAKLDEYEHSSQILK